MVNLSSWGKHMNVYECLENRRTIRRFKSVPVKEETLTKILNAARWAPSSRNQQPWHLIIIRAKETLNHINTKTKKFGNTQLIFWRNYE